MTFRIFYLFYALAILLLVLGILTKDVETINAGWHTTIIKGMWTFFIPTATSSLLTAFTYHYWFNTGRPVHGRTIIIHFLLVTFGLLLSLDTFQLTTVLISSGAPDITAINTERLLFIFLGPVFLIAALILFIIVLKKAKRTTT